LDRNIEDRLPEFLASFLVVLLILSTGMFHFLPRHFVVVIVSWAMLSLSVGVSFGHCVLNEP
jgi:hypothetical protein